MLNHYPFGTVLGGKYRIERLIRCGGMGVVYEVRQLNTEQLLAAKVLHPQLAVNSVLVERFKLEALAAVSIGHKNIVDILDMGCSSDGGLYLIMEYLDGASLRTTLEQENLLEPGRAARITCQVLSALQAAHDVGIIHRDIKPDNVFLCREDGRSDLVKLLDFGISKFIASDEKVAMRLTQAGIVLGTPWYMSPEQSIGEPELSPQTDIYSLGVVLFEAITGTLPFDAPSYTALLIKISSSPPPDPCRFHPLLPKEYARVITTAMARDPRNRFSSCAEFREQLLPFTTRTLPLSGKKDKCTSMPPLRCLNGTTSDTPLEVPSPRPHLVARIRKAVFIGLGRATEQIGLDGGGWLRVASAPDVHRALPMIAEFSPHLVVANATVLREFEGSLVCALPKQVPGFRFPIIQVDLNSDTPGLTILEWRVEHATYSERSAPLVELGAEIERAVIAEPPVCARAAEIQDIGYYNVVERDGQAIHVQTEVVADDDIRVHTMVIKGGQVIDSKERTHCATEDDIVTDSSLAARSQHEAALAKVRRGEFG